MNPDLSKVVSLLSEKSRSAILLGLMDGLAHPASELAMMAKVKPQTASFHLSLLEENGIIHVESHGRHRYYRLCNPEVAQIIESFLAISPIPKIVSLRQADQMRGLKSARTCYDHLAGELGVAVTEALLSNNWIEEQENDYSVTPSGDSFFASLTIDISSLKQKRRTFSRKCLDWSERKYHLAGALGHAILHHLLDNNSIQRISGLRTIQLTERGKEYVMGKFGLRT